MIDQSPSRPGWRSGIAPRNFTAREAPIPAPFCLTSAPEAAPPPGSSRPQRPIFSIAERLVQIWIANEQELEGLRKLRLRQRRVRAYANGPHAGALLAGALLARIDDQICKACARLGANDREARRLLAELRRSRACWLGPDARGQPDRRHRRYG